MLTYRLTFTESVSKQWWEQFKGNKQPFVRRIYRWGSYWGILDLNTSSSVSVPTNMRSLRPWVTEKRVAITETSAYILESIESCDTKTPPSHIDDCWDEECVNIENIAEYSGLLSVSGLWHDISNWCLKHNVHIPTELPTTPTLESNFHVKKP